MFKLENLSTLLSFAATILILFVVAYVLEKLAAGKNEKKEKVFTVRKIAGIGIISAMAAVLMLLEVPLFFAPADIYKLDFSEIPILIGSFAYGPAAGVMMEFIKVALKCLFKPSSTAFVGELANFAVGCSLVLPASTIYCFKKTKKNAIFGTIVGILCMTVFGSAFNAVYLIPTFAKMFHMDLEAIIGMGAGSNKLVSGNSLTEFILFITAPFNLVKGLIVGVITVLLYKYISSILKGNESKEIAKP
ncbi:MAG: ECF transporter S component [Lachnospiraceae bacterium]|nr:ECF transporter S component [Lachnospiraceae bacterium]